MYSKVIGGVTKLVAKLKELPLQDESRRHMSEVLLNKLYDMGLVKSKSSLAPVENLAVSTICRRRLPVVMVRLHMAENLKEASTFIEQGHIRVGPHTITDSSFIVTRNMEDYVTWVDGSKIKRTIMKYNDRNLWFWQW